MSVRVRESVFKMNLLHVQSDKIYRNGHEKPKPKEMDGNNNKWMREFTAHTICFPKEKKTHTHRITMNILSELTRRCLNGQKGRWHGDIRSMQINFESGILHFMNKNYCVKWTQDNICAAMTEKRFCGWSISLLYYFILDACSQA